MSTGDDEGAQAGATSPATPGVPARRPRRAVRAPGTVGTDDSLLRSTLPAAPPSSNGTATSDPCPGSRIADRSTDALLAARSADDSDVGWGEGRDDNDDRLRLDKPPHWG